MNAPRGLIAAAVALLAACAADTADERAVRRAGIDAAADEALAALYRVVPRARPMGAEAAGILIFPSVVKAGFVGLAGETGDGVLRVGGESVAYYGLSAAGDGPSLGAEVRSKVLMFMTEAALAGFRGTERWEAGLDGSVSVPSLDASGRLDADGIRSDIVAFIYGTEGLIGLSTVEGTRFTLEDL